MGRPPLNMARARGAPALKKWPPAPRDFSKGEKVEWAKLGRAAMAAGTISHADLLAAEHYARSAARLRAAERDPGAKVTATSALAKLCAQLLGALGLTPQSRKSVAAPSAPPPAADDPLSEF